NGANSNGYSGNSIGYNGNGLGYNGNSVTRLSTNGNRVNGGYVIPGPVNGQNPYAGIGPYDGPVLGAYPEIPLAGPGYTGNGVYGGFGNGIYGGGNGYNGNGF